MNDVTYSFLSPTQGERSTKWMTPRLPFILHSTESANARFERCVRFFVSVLVQGSALCKNFRIFLVISSNPRSALFKSCLLWAFFPLGILSLWAFCLFRHNVFWAFYPVWHFVVLGQNVFWAFYPWAFCHTWAFCHFGHFIIQSRNRSKSKSIKSCYISLPMFLHVSE